MPGPGVFKALGVVVVIALVVGAWQMGLFTGIGSGEDAVTVFSDFEKDYAAAVSGGKVDPAKWDAIQKKFNAPVQGLLMAYQPYIDEDPQAKAIIRTTRAMIKTMGQNADDHGKVVSAYSQYESEKKTIK